LHINFGNYIAIKSNEYISNIIYELFDKEDKIEPNNEFHVRMIFEEVNKTIKDFFEDNYDHPYHTNISPFYYPMSNFGFARLLVNILKKILESEDKYKNSFLFEQIKEFLSDLNQNIMKAEKKGYYVEINHILHQIYTFTVILISYKNKFEDIQTRFKICELLEGYIYYIFHNPIYSSFEPVKNRGLSYPDYIDMYNSIIGIMLCEKKKGEKLEGNDLRVILKWIDGMIELIDKFKDKIYYEDIGRKLENYKIIHPLKNLYYSIKLIGGWLFYLCDKLYFFKIRQIINEQPEITKEKNAFGFANDLLGYSHDGYTIVDLHGNKKYLTPPYLAPPNFSDYNKKLFNVNEFKKFLDELKMSDE
jgi:hypothetical protein